MFLKILKIFFFMYKSESFPDLITETSKDWFLKWFFVINTHTDIASWLHAHWKTACYF